MPPWRVLLASVLSLAVGSSCAPQHDTVFQVVTHDTTADGGSGAVQLVEQHLRVREANDAVTIAVGLTQAPTEPLTIEFELQDGTAQSHCQSPDYQEAEGSLAFAPGQDTASVAIGLSDDDYAELDETFFLTVTRPVDLAGQRLQITIEDDDRDAIVQAADFGLESGQTADQSEALQAALDAAAEAGRGVVQVAPGQYFVRGVTVPQGVTLTGQGAVLVRPSMLPDGTVMFNVSHSGATDSELTLIERLTLDGNREQQGPYQDKELEEAHLIQVYAEATSAGRARLGVQNVVVTSGTADGVALAQNADVTLCDIVADDMWREAVGILGGNSDLSVRGLTASARVGTVGLWFGGWPEGYQGSTVQHIVLEDVTLDSGDLEAELEPGSSLQVRRLEMSAPPFRVRAPGARVDIRDSQLYLGLASERHNTFAEVSDVTIADTRLVMSEIEDESGTAVEANRSMAIVTVLWDFEQPAAPVVGNFVLDRCQFDVDANVEQTDTVYAVGTSGSGERITVSSSVLGDGVESWFAPDCSGCVLE